MQVVDYLRTVPDSLGGGADLEGMSPSPDSWNMVLAILVRPVIVQNAEYKRQRPAPTEGAISEFCV